MTDVTRLHAIVGAQSNLTNGQDAATRMNRQGGLYGADASASLQEAVLRGRAFGFCSPSGVTSQAGLSATTPVATLYNPAGSGVNAVLWYAGATFSVAFTAAAAVWLAANTNPTAAAVTGTPSTTHKNLLLDSSNIPSCVPLLAATLPAAPAGICLLGVGLTGAISTIPQLQTIGRWFDGSVIIAPGCALSVQTGTASGTSGMFTEYIWEEIQT